MKRIYISGPYTNGDVANNVRAQIIKSSILMNYGYSPFVPVFYHFQHLLFPRMYEDWMSQCLSWVEVCDALLRLPGISPGADREVAHATKFGIPVYHSIDELLRAVKHG